MKVKEGEGEGRVISAVKIEICFLSACKISDTHKKHYTSIITIQPSTLFAPPLATPFPIPAIRRSISPATRGQRGCSPDGRTIPHAWLFIQKHPPRPPTPPLDTLPLEIHPQTVTTLRINTVPSVALEAPSDEVQEVPSVVPEHIPRPTLDLHRKILQAVEIGLEGMMTMMMMKMRYSSLGILVC